MSITTSKEAMQHFLHDIDVVYYGNKDNPVSVTIECLDCNTVLIDFPIEEGENENA